MQRIAAQRGTTQFNAAQCVIIMHSAALQSADSKLELNYTQCTRIQHKAVTYSTKQHKYPVQHNVEHHSTM